MGRRLGLALVHYPVRNRRGETIGSAVTNLDIHDIARTARTYGLDCFYIVSPDPEQHRLVGELLEHWLKGKGGELNPARKEALSLVRLVYSLDELYTSFSGECEGKPLVVGTSARAQGRTVEFRGLRERLAEEQPLLLLFGTAWGLAPEALEKVDFFLPPIEGSGDYNHLPVRSAVAVVLDRLVAREDFL